MADRDSRPPAHGDEAELFRAFNHELVQSVARSVRTSSPQVVEDACGFAWAKFIENQPDRNRNWKGWLFRVAQYESWRLERQANRDLPTRTGDFEPGTLAARLVDAKIALDSLRDTAGHYFDGDCKELYADVAIRVIDRYAAPSVHQATKVIDQYRRRTASGRLRLSAAADARSA
jgi:hypothetical protein